jgi:hypothetical protein
MHRMDSQTFNPKRKVATRFLIVSTSLFQDLQILPMISMLSPPNTLDHANQGTLTTYKKKETKAPQLRNSRLVDQALSTTFLRCKFSTLKWVLPVPIPYPASLHSKIIESNCIPNAVSVYTRAMNQRRPKRGMETDLKVYRLTNCINSKNNIWSGILTIQYWHCPK